MTTTDMMVEPRASASAAFQGDGWDLDGIPRRFWPKIREIFESGRFQQVQQQHSAAATAVANALVSAITLQAIAQKAGGAGEGLGRAAASLIGEWDGELCPPYKVWPPKKKRDIAEEVVDILSQVIDVVPQSVATGIRTLGASMEQKLSGAATNIRG